VDMNAALMSAPAAEPPPPPRPAQLPQMRERMDTLPPVARRSGRPAVLALVVVAAGAMIAGLVFVLRARTAPAERTGSVVAAEAPAAATAATPPTPTPAAPPPASAEPVASAAPPPAAS